jgi:uncharacterized membrane protein
MMQTQIRRAPTVGRSDGASPVRGENPPVNIDDGQRWASALGGVALALLGLERGQTAGLALTAAGAALMHRGITGHCYVSEMLRLDMSSRGPNSKVSVRAGTGVRVESAFTVGKSPADLYLFWRRLENLPRIMTHLESVETSSSRLSHWIASGPLGMRVQWDAEIYNDEPNRLIAWRSLAGAEVDIAGSVHFEAAPAGRGTVVRVNLKYDAPGGKVGALLSRLFHAAPDQEITEDLRRFKRFMEAGEVPTTKGQTSCRI